MRALLFDVCVVNKPLAHGGDGPPSNPYGVGPSLTASPCTRRPQALVLACQEGQSEGVELLLRHWTDPTIFSDKGRYSVLMAAASKPGKACVLTTLFR